jgi:dephospho-CoA kinase
MIKVALTGKMAAGKDTLAAYLIENYRFERYAFADPIRDLCRRLFPDRMEGGKDRELLQKVGQFMRTIDSDVWVKALFRKIEEDLPVLEKLKRNIIVTDLRQPNEFERLKAEGFYIVRVYARDAVRLERMKARGDRFKLMDLHHETELYVDSFEVDFEVDNNGRWIDMAEQASVIMREIENREKISR